MRKISNLEVNKIPAPTWNKLKMNSTFIENAAADSSALKKEYAFSELVTKREKFVAGDGEADELFDGLDSHVITISSQHNPPLSSPYLFQLEYPDGENKGDVFDITVEENTIAEISFNIESDKDASGFAALKFRVNLKENAVLHIVQIGKLGKGFTLLSNIEADLDKSAKLILTTIPFAEKSYLGATVNLNGKHSSFDSHTAYILENGQKIDMNYTANHIGKKTNSEIKAAGALKEGSFKLSRQTINFLTGCSGSKGAENEEVLLLDDNVVSKSVPLILCTEEDVEGEHGASIGQPDEGVMYYLQSRGLDEKTIYDMLSEAILKSAASRIHSDVKSNIGIAEE